MILACQNISKSFGEKEILKGISFHIEEKEKLAIVGINGSGKTTLLRIIMGEESADEGQVVRACRFAKQRLQDRLGSDPELRLLGPTPLAVVRVNNRYRYRVHIHCRCTSTVRDAVSQTVIECCTDKRFRGVSVFADNDPMD